MRICLAKRKDMPRVFQCRENLLLQENLVIVTQNDALKFVNVNRV